MSKRRNVAVKHGRMRASKRRHVSPNDGEPSALLCPITHEIMTDPVVTADGQSYERYAIEQWLRHSTLSPLTNEPLTHLALTPNMALRRLIREWIEQREAAGLAGKDSHHGSHHRRGRRAFAASTVASPRMTSARLSSSFCAGTLMLRRCHSRTLSRTTKMETACHLWLGRPSRPWAPSLKAGQLSRMAPSRSTVPRGQYWPRWV